MTERIEKKLKLLKDGEYKMKRALPEKESLSFPEGISFKKVHTELHKYAIESEKPFLFEDDRFGFNRYMAKMPRYIVGKNVYYGSIGNLTINYEYTLRVGMDTLLRRIEEKLSLCTDSERREEYESMRDSIIVCLRHADKYRELARVEGATELYEALCVVPHNGAKTFHQALVFMKFIQYTLRLNRNNHITLGGFDKYMLPYFESDLEKGASEDELFELLEDFFITLNMDSDTYFGEQQGDNGMSMVLGGRDVDGKDRYNKLSELCMKASMELCLIDPKINLRVDKSTPLSRLEFATELTKKGLGFPQYCNDDVIIPGLLRLGYDPSDAYNYTVAACWEVLVPGNAYELISIGKVNFPLAVEKAVNEHLSECESFDVFLEKVKESVEEECVAVANKIKNIRVGTSPYLSVFVDDCIERGLDIGEGGAINNNFGAHGVAISSAADAIAAVKKCIFDDQKYTKTELLKAIKDNFEGHEELRNYLISCPKMGNNDDYVDQYSDMLMNIFENVFSRYKNRYGGILRPGTGSAMEYIWSARDVGATADGRYSKAPFGSSFSPSPIAKLKGPLSCIQSFTRHDMTKIINGGPLTMEIHDNTFRNSDGVKKVAALVKIFIDLGGHQLQLNAINKDVLLDAQAHPENHKNLIVRVWGWSGYFCELDQEFQNHIISRTEFNA